jgi:predicted PurR-regulated permease PerM
MNNSLNFVAYLIYLPLVIALTWYVAHTLFKNGKTFMLDIFNQKEEIALSTNRLFETGFYLINVGFAFTIMNISEEVYTNRTLLEILSAKIGGFSIYLGFMLFLNLYMFFRGRKISNVKRKSDELLVNS